jgi:hypothetical protein
MQGHAPYLPIGLAPRDEVDCLSSSSSTTNAPPAAMTGDFRRNVRLSARPLPFYFANSRSRWIVGLSGPPYERKVPRPA